MTLILSGSDGLSDIDGSAATPAIRGTDANTGIFFPAADTIAFSEGGVEAARFDSSGQLGIGTTSPAAPLHVNGASGSAAFIVGNTGDTTRLEVTATTNVGAMLDITDAGNNRSMMFAISGTERARIDSSGNLLVGATTATITAKLGIYQTTTEPAIFINPSNASYNGTIIYANTTRAASASFDFLGMYANSVAQFRVSGSGVIYAQNTAVQAISDQRLKENIRDSSDGLSVINGLRPVRYDWKEGFGNDRKDQLGFIAQEVEAVFPEAVSEWQVNKEDETVYKTVGPSALIPVLVKAIQEQQALITQLQADVAALKAV